MTEINYYRDSITNDFVFQGRISSIDMAMCELTSLEMAILNDGQQGIVETIENIRIWFAAIDRHKKKTPTAERSGE